MHLCDELWVYVGDGSVGWVIVERHIQDTLGSGTANWLVLERDLIDLEPLKRGGDLA